MFFISRLSSHISGVVGSDEELSALKQAYLDSKGDMQKIIDSVMCASNDDDQRFRDILMPLIQKKELPRYKKFTDESAASKKRRLAKVSSSFAVFPDFCQFWPPNLITLHCEAVV